MIVGVMAGTSFFAFSVTGTDPTDPTDGQGDPDGDGFSNYGEFIAGTDPNNNDTDGDGLFDGWEHFNFLNPTSTTGYNGSNGNPDSREYDADPSWVAAYEYRGANGSKHQHTNQSCPYCGQFCEGDSWNNTREQEMGTNPWSSDTDQDGKPDCCDPKPLDPENDDPDTNENPPTQPPNQEPDPTSAQGGGPVLVFKAPKFNPVDPLNDGKPFYWRMNAYDKYNTSAQTQTGIENWMWSYYEYSDYLNATDNESEVIPTNVYMPATGMEAIDDSNQIFFVTYDALAIPGMFPAGLYARQVYNVTSNTTDEPLNIYNDSSFGFSTDYYGEGKNVVSYQFNATFYNITEEALNASGVPSVASMPWYYNWTVGNATIEAQIASLADEILTNASLTHASAPWLKAKALRDYLKDPARFLYNPDFEQAPNGTDPVWYFLNVTREGVCWHYASSFVLMCRYVGVPARYTVGYSYGKQGNDGMVHVMSSDAHAWAEIAMLMGSPSDSQFTWVTMDPTAPQRDTDGDGIPDLQEEQASPTAQDNWTDLIGQEHNGNESYSDTWYQTHMNMTDPRDALLDPDLDGLINIAEYIFSTNSFNYDTDKDYLIDGGDVWVNCTITGTAMLYDNASLNVTNQIPLQGTPIPWTPDPLKKYVVLPFRNHVYQEAITQQPIFNATVVENITETQTHMQGWVLVDGRYLLKDADITIDNFIYYDGEGNHKYENSTTYTPDGSALIYYTDPNSQDTDGDYLPDGAEFLVTFSEPLCADIDNDNLTDGFEYQAHTDYYDADTDNDTLCDSFEVMNGLNPLNGTGINGADGDPDNDGLTNFEEMIGGSDPRSADGDQDGRNDSTEVNELANPPYEVTWTNVYYTVEVDPNTGHHVGVKHEVVVTNKTNPRDPDTDKDEINDNEDVKPLSYNVRPKVRVIVTAEPTYVRKGEEFSVEGYVEYESSPGVWARITSQVNMTVFVNQSGAGFMTSIAQLNPTSANGSFKITCVIPNEIFAGDATIVYQVHSNSAYFGCWATKDTPQSAPAYFVPPMMMQPGNLGQLEAHHGSPETTGGGTLDSMQSSIEEVATDTLDWAML